MQQSGPKSIGFFGTRNMGFLHQQLIEILSYAMVITVRLSVLLYWRRGGGGMPTHHRVVAVEVAV